MPNKQVKLFPETHAKVAKHIAGTDVTLKDFFNKAALNQIKAEKVEKRILKSKA